MAPGQPVPDRHFVNLKGESQNLSSFFGKPLLVNFWASWCTPCLIEIPELVAFHKLVSHNNQASVIGIACEDEADAVRDFVERSAINFPVLIDTQNFCREVYKTSGYPETIFLDAEGKLKLVLDEESATSEVRIMGPRRWSSPAWKKQLLREK